MNDATLSLIIDTLVDELGVDSDAVVPTARLQEDLNLSSLEIVELLMMLEDRTGVRLASEVAPDPQRMATVEALAALVSEATAAS